MSRLGKIPIKLSKGTQVKIENNFIIIKGPKGELKIKINDLVKIELKDEEIVVRVDNPEEKKGKSLWGLYRSLINNMVVGVNQGFEKKLEINGVGYKASVRGRKIILNLGFSHPVEYNLPEGITADIKDNIITLGGIDKQLVGEVAAQIRELKKPEPYKGKGIKYIDEVIRRKVGKAAVKME